MNLINYLTTAFITISLVWGNANIPVQIENDTPNFHVYLPLVASNDGSPYTYLQPASINLSPKPLNGQLYLVIDSGGQPHIFWAGSFGTSTNAYHVYLKDSGWSTPDMISVQDSNTRLTSQPAVGNQNDIHLIFSSNIKTGVPYQVRYMKWDGFQWGSQTILLDNSTSRTVSGEVRLNNQGNPYVYARVDGLTSGISRKYYYLDWAGSGFGPAKSFNTPLTKSDDEYSWLDSNGGVRLIGPVYSSTTGKYTFHYANWKNGTFLITDQALTDSMEMDTSFLDNQNNTHHVGLATSQGGTINSLYHQCLKNDLTFDQSQIISGSVNVKYFVWGYDETHTPNLAFTSDEGQNITLQIWSGCQVSKQYNFVLPAPPSNGTWGQILATSFNQQAGKACFLIKDKIKIFSWWMQCIEIK